MAKRISGTRAGGTVGSGSEAEVQAMGNLAYKNRGVYNFGGIGMYSTGDGAQHMSRGEGINGGNYGTI